jgi:hypothetical protein
MDKIRRQHRQSIFLPLGPAESNVHIPAIAIADLGQTLAERRFRVGSFVR